MQRHTFVGVAVVAIGLNAITVGVFAQQARGGGSTAQQGQAPGAAGGTIVCNSRVNCPSFVAPDDTPPALLWRETWRMPPSPTTANRGELTEGDAKRRVHLGGGAAANPRLELKTYGPFAADLLAYEHEGRFDLWNGLASPIVITLRDKENFVEISNLARLRAMVRTAGLHVLYPVVKLANGTFLAGSRLVQNEGDFIQVDIAFNGLRWFTLNTDRVVTQFEVLNPDLSKVDEIGFVDMMTPGGHGRGGWVNISTVELYAKPVRR